MKTLSFNRKELHEMVDAIPDDMVDEVFEGFKGVLVKYLAKSMMQGFNDKIDDLQFCHDIMDNGGPEKNSNVVRLPKIKRS